MNDVGVGRAVLGRLDREGLAGTRCGADAHALHRRQGLVTGPLGQLDIPFRRVIVTAGRCKIDTDIARHGRRAENPEVDVVCARQIARHARVVKRSILIGGRAGDSCCLGVVVARALDGRQYGRANRVLGIAPASRTDLDKISASCRNLTRQRGQAPCGQALRRVKNQCRTRSQATGQRLIHSQG